MRKKLYWKQILLFCFSFFFLLGMKVEADDKKIETLRVGFSPSGIFMKGNEDGPKSGYGYEYLQRIAGYGGWKYEYIYATFPEQLEMLKNGDLDIVVNVSYTEERTQWMNLSKIPMGKESYYICSRKGEKLITNDVSSLAEKRIGVTKNSYQLELLREWIKKNNISCTIVETEGEIPGSEVDAYVTMDINSLGEWNPLFKIGSSEYYFALNKQNPELEKAFNEAQKSVLEISPYYQEELYAKYFGSTLVNDDFNKEEEKWLKKNSVIYLGYYDNYMPFSDYSINGEIKGYLSKILKEMSIYLDEYGVTVKPIPYTSMEDMKEDMKSGGLHMIYPIYKDFWIAENEGFLLTDSLENLQISVLYRDVPLEQRYDTIAVTSNDPFQENYVNTHYPNAQKIYYPSMEDCLKAVEQQRANSTMVSSLMVWQLSEKFNNLKSYSMVEDTELCMAISLENKDILSILNRIFQQFPETMMEEALIEYTEENSQRQISNNTKKMILISSVVVSVLLAVILLYSEIVRRRALKQEAINNEIIDILGTVVEYRSVESGQHVKRVKGFTRILGEYLLKEHPEYRLTKHQLDIIVSASALHDVGKVAISDEILLKPGKLTPEEYEIMKEHTVKGSDILNHLYKIMEPEYARISHEICRYHHERFDGRGYPERLVGDEIPISAQLVSIADVYDALTNERCYKAAFSAEEAFQMIMDGQCGSFSPKLLEGLKNTKEEFIKCSENYK